MIPSTYHGDPVLIGRALYEYEAACKAFDDAKKFRRLGARHACRAFLKITRGRLVRFEELVRASEVER